MPTNIFFYFNKFNIDLFFKNSNIFYLLLSNKFLRNNLFFLTSLNSFKYDWCVRFNKLDNIKFFYTGSKETDFYFSEFLYFNEFNTFNLILSESNENYIDSIIDFKLQSGFLKKEFNIYSVLLDKFNKIKHNDYIFDEEDINENNFSDFFFFDEYADSEYINFEDVYSESFDDLENTNNDKVETDYNTNLDSSDEDLDDSFIFSGDFDTSDFYIKNKNDSFVDSLNYDFIGDFDYFDDLVDKDSFLFTDQKDLKFDFKSNKLKLFKTNRSILSFFIKKKIKNKTKFSKIIKNLIKKPFYDFIMHFEFSLKNILLRSHFFFNENDINFFVKNKYILVNNNIALYPNQSLKVFDKINIIFDKYYYYYYRSVLNNIHKNVTRYSNYVWLSEQSNYDNNKQKKSHIPTWIVNLIYFREDVPNFLEIDFITMNLIILYKPLLFELDWTKIKFLNYYHRHLYNWRFII